MQKSSLKENLSMQTIKTIGLEEARIIAEAVVSKAIADNEGPIAVAVCGRDGFLKYFVKMDGASHVTGRMAINKAYTAAFWGRKTEELRGYIQKIGNQLAWYGSDLRVETVIPGGHPIKLSDGTVLGGVGVSGKRRLEPKHKVKDSDLAKTGTEALLL